MRPRQMRITSYFKSDGNGHSQGPMPRPVPARMYVDIEGLVQSIRNHDLALSEDASLSHFTLTCRG